MFSPRVTPRSLPCKWTQHPSGCNRCYHLRPVMTKMPAPRGNHNLPKRVGRSLQSHHLGIVYQTYQLLPICVGRRSDPPPHYMSLVGETLLTTILSRFTLGVSSIQLLASKYTTLHDSAMVTSSKISSRVRMRSVTAMWLLTGNSMKSAEKLYCPGVRSEFEIQL